MGIWKHFGKSGRRENKIKIYGKNNKICVFDDTEEVPLAEGEGIYGLEISVLGEGNIIRISKSAVWSGCRLVIIGTGNLFDVGVGLIKQTSFVIQKSDNSRIVIGSDIFIGSGTFLIEEPETFITIGRDCMFSDNITVRCSDGHPIYDKQGNIINRAYGIAIGNHVWLGCHVTVLKNVELADDIVVGAGSVVTKSFIRSGVIIAGVPAKTVKEDIQWSKDFLGRTSAEEQPSEK